MRKTRRKKLYDYGAILLCICLCACSTDYSPRPKGYPYFDLKPTPYYIFSKYENLQFEVSSKAKIEEERDSAGVKWFTLTYPEYNSSIFCTFFSADRKKIRTLAEESRRLADFHGLKGSVEEMEYERPEDKVYARVFLLGGGSASPVQFAATDSARCFLRGALYFSSGTNSDSIAPIKEYIYQDIRVLIETIKWKQ
ncbi:MAG: hypothetical protein LBR64_00380 [Dysgonamonadaceae bacterium]|jgi:gliding motility-associated lipoprotein GldD|nr:hypothetical protein [Dysgonamonadaceae bacterium]